MSFRLVPKSVTLSDLERRNGPHFALLVINTNLPDILHRFRYMAFDIGPKWLLGYPSCV